MKKDLDAFMENRELDAILVTGPARHNPAMVYLTGGGNLTNAVLIKKRGNDPVLFHYSMEREEAAKLGLQTKKMDDYRFDELLETFDGDRLQANLEIYRRMLVDAGIRSGRLALYGKTDVGSIYSIFSALERSQPELTVIGEFEDSVLLQAMATKDELEIERIRQMGQVTTKVVGNVADFLISHRVREGVLVQDDGQPLTVGEVKRRINLWLTLQGVENPEGTIFAIGRDAGVPHSVGNPDDPLRLGQTIVFDIFPCEAGGGYYYDFTRTWCLGHAPDEVQAVYEDVLDVYQQIMNELELHASCRPYQLRASELFQAKGHKTLESDPQTEEGYVHSLGHGLGLHVHERPWFGIKATEEDRLDPGVVVTIEPGLYYPERGMGVRLENTVWVRPDGQMEVLVDYPMDLVLPIQAG